MPDIFGWNGGRTRVIADHVADTLGCYVVVPKICLPAVEEGTDGAGFPPDFDLMTRGAELGPFIKALKWADLRPKMAALLRHMVDSGLSKIGIVGYCWGGWVVSHCLADPDMPEQVACGISPHPSITCEESMHGGNVLELMARVKRPMFLLPAGNDSDRYRPGGDLWESLKASQPGSKLSLNFGEMKHGTAHVARLCWPARLLSTQLWVRP